MSAFPSSLSSSALATRLRAAGCVFAEEETRLLMSAASSADALAAMVERRTAGHPLEHVLGWAEFCGMRMDVGDGVFVPRRRSEFLVDQAAAVCGEGAVVLDLCCGSGALGAALAARAGRVELHSADVEPAAVRCARRNVAAVGGHVYEGDLYEPLPAGLRGRVDVLLANVPYVPAEEVALLPPEARIHEPLIALDGGSDGLDVLRRVAAEAPQWLVPGGCLLVETSERQVGAAVGTVAGSGLTSRVAVSEELCATVVIGTRPRGKPPGSSTGGI